MFFPRPPFRGPPPPYLSPSDPPLLQVSLSARRILSHDAGYAKSWMETTAQTGGSPSAKGASSRIPFPLLAMSARAGRKNAGLVAVRVLPLSVSGRSGDILLESTANRLEPLLHSRLPSFLPSFLFLHTFAPAADLSIIDDFTDAPSGRGLESRVVVVGRCESGDLVAAKSRQNAVRVRCRHIGPPHLSLSSGAVVHRSVSRPPPPPPQWKFTSQSVNESCVG